jgi:hypothetical protein
MATTRILPETTPHGSSPIATSDVFCCRECGAPVAFVELPGGDLAYECVRPTCGKTIYSDHPEGLAIIDDLVIELPAPHLTTQDAATYLALSAQKAGDAAGMRAANKAALQLSQGVTHSWACGDLLIASSTHAGIVHRVHRLGDVWACSCEAAQNGRSCWHASAAQILELAQEAPALLELPARAAAEVA